MVLVTVIFVAALIAVIVGMIITTDDFPKRWRKIKFEAKMSWNGISHGTVDLFNRGKDKVGKRNLSTCESVKRNWILLHITRAISTATQSCYHYWRQQRHRVFCPPEAFGVRDDGGHGSA